ncbi:ABC transporter permease [Quadrisphaera sp. KR29]|uniref:ABC transporter permease n=1 Tax=Quadrisphaera sp. KR29 TaxID=3461391 RepID=UPI0040451A12
MSADPSTLDGRSAQARGLGGSGDPSAPRTRRSGPGTRRRISPWWGALPPLALLGLWQLLVALQVYPPVNLPAPAAVVRAAGDLWERGLLQQHIAISTQRVLLGFAAGAAVGLAVGSLVGLSRWADALLHPTIGGLRAVPSLAWVPLLGIYVGLGEPPKVILIAIGAFFPVFTTTASALRHVDAQLVEAGRAYGLRGLSLLAQVQLPAAVPAVLAGLRLALAQAWLFLVAAELIASSIGLGFLLTESGNNGRTDRIFLAIITLAVLGKLSDAVVGLFERWALRRWA